MDLMELTCHYTDGLDKTTLWYNQKEGFCKHCDEFDVILTVHRR